VTARQEFTSLLARVESALGKVGEACRHLAQGFAISTLGAGAAVRAYVELEERQLRARTKADALADAARRFPGAEIRSTPQGLVRWEAGDGNRAWRRAQLRKLRKGKKQRLR